MDSFVFAAVLFAAACHAGWNTAIKGGVDTVATTSLIAIGAGLVALAFLPFVGLPLRPAWPLVAASVIIHLLYFIGLSEGYRVGDLGQVYPLARGSAPLMTAALSNLLIGETLGPLAWIGIVALAAGVLVLSARGGHALARFNAHATGLALFTATTICAYSLVDGIGARLAGSAHAYTASLFVGNGIVLAGYGLARRGRAAIPALAAHWRMGLAAS
jgi:drug/metabolite transporter (DMT)-like permease